MLYVIEVKFFMSVMESSNHNGGLESSESHSTFLHKIFASSSINF